MIYLPPDLLEAWDAKRGPLSRSASLIPLIRYILEE